MVALYQNARHRRPSFDGREGPPVVSGLRSQPRVHRNLSNAYGSIPAHGNAGPALCKWLLNRTTQRATHAQKARIFLVLRLTRSVDRIARIAIRSVDRIVYNQRLGVSARDIRGEPAG